uniref:Tyrosine specific protein phosphatases domain-containing protein n=1 Tax=Glossina brevipalpis TaxID=37001 RepID=A0A1A9WW40_9MUSC
MKFWMLAINRHHKLIGVHCTHGVNRTGYFICSYMISELTMKPLEAIRKFVVARGHKIERFNYLDALNRLSKSKIAPDTSSWRRSNNRIEIETVNKLKRTRENDYYRDNNYLSWRHSYLSRPSSTSKANFYNSKLRSKYKETS